MKNKKFFHKKSTKEKIKAKFHTIFHRHHHKFTKFLHHWHHFFHYFLHLEEILIITIFGGIGLLMAYSTGLNGDQYKELNNKIDSALQTAISQLGPNPYGDKIISKRELDCKVENGFYCGYCTYGAARISPEFFPYENPTKQIRSWTGDAHLWCEHAKKAGFVVSKKAKQGALIVYEAGKRYSKYGHVGKVIYYKDGDKRAIVRDENYTRRYEMTDRRQNLNDPDIKCYIYPPKKEIKLTDEALIPDLPLPQVEEKTGITKQEILEESGENQVTQETPNLKVNYIPQTLTLKANKNKISNLADKFFLENNEISLQIPKTQLNVGESEELILKINSKNGKFRGILPFTIYLLPTNNNISLQYSSIKFLPMGELKIKLNAIKKGETELIMNIGLDKVAKAKITVN